MVKYKKLNGKMVRRLAFSAFLCPALLTLFLAVSLAAQPKDFTRWVNPFIGTGGHGHTFPGATMPFGMVQLSPDTRIDNWDGSSGYHYSDDIIYGFSHTHLSGTGIPDGCDILFMPTVGEPQFFAKGGDKSVNGYASRFSHAGENAEPGYYSVKLDDDGILAEMTSTKRVGFHRYTFPKSDKANLILDLKWRDRMLDSLLNVRETETAIGSRYGEPGEKDKVVHFAREGTTRVEGFRRSSSWAKNQTVYFVAEFSQPFVAGEAGNGLEFTSFRSGAGGRTSTNGGLLSLQFQSAPEKPLLLKVAISFVSIENARKNLAAELPGWDFEKVRADAKAAWNKELSRIEVSGGTPDQTTNFYTALYHTMIQPNIFNDVDGQYKGHDGKIHSLQKPAREQGRNEQREHSLQKPTRKQGRNVQREHSLQKPTRKQGRNVQRDHSLQKPAREQGRNVQSNSSAGIATKTTKNSVDSFDLPNGRASASGDQYSVFSLWDTFRAAHPLYTIIDQKRTVDFINTFIRQYEQGGRLPVWELWGEETDTMIGYHAVSVIADAMSKGIKGFDYEKAYKAAKYSAELDHFGLAAYKKRGYISGEDENESVSKTLEYAYNDYCIGTMAQALMREKLKEPVKYRLITDKQLDAESDKFFTRSLYYRNLFDPETKFFRPKRNGGFLSPFRPNEVTFHFTEGNSWQYSFFVPHDVSALAELYGGKIQFAKKLDELFTTEQTLAGREQPDITGLIGQYAHGNEPSHHMVYLYNYANQPWKTQVFIRKIVDEFYKNAPDGLIGNEDCGQMSAWYILSTLGFYEVNPSRPTYDIGTPLFKEVTVRLENGKSFVITAANVSAKNIYVKSVKLNGKPHRQTYFQHRDLMNGGTLEFEMTDQPVKDWFDEFSFAEVGGKFVSVPVIEGDRVFRDRTTVTLRSPTPHTRITYTLDNHGEEFARTTKEYTGPFIVDETSTIEAYATDIGNGTESLRSEARFAKRRNDWTVKLVSSFNTQYTGGGDDAIIDGLRGNENFASGEWQGFQGKTFEAVIDLQRETEIKSVGGSFLQAARSWIWMPDRIEFEASSDGAKFTRIAEIKPGFPQQEMNGVTKEFRQSIPATKARFIRVKAYNFGKIPAWHPGAGGDPWIFIDEIFIN
jgi:putative alpha-1,2-mannosidase